MSVRCFVRGFPFDSPPDTTTHHEVHPLRLLEFVCWIAVAGGSNAAECEFAGGARWTQDCVSDWPSCSSRAHSRQPIRCQQDGRRGSAPCVRAARPVRAVACGGGNQLRSRLASDAGRVCSIVTSPSEALQKLFGTRGQLPCGSSPDVCAVETSGRSRRGCGRPRIGFGSRCFPCWDQWLGCGSSTSVRGPVRWASKPIPVGPKWSSGSSNPGPWPARCRRGSQISASPTSPDLRVVVADAGRALRQMSRGERAPLRSGLSRPALCGDRSGRDPRRALRRQSAPPRDDSGRGGIETPSSAGHRRGPDRR